jgi:YYY domain-containing protein
MPDSIAVLTWWGLVQIFSLIGLPVAFRLFRRLPDRGYGVSKALGLLLPSYLFWLLGVLGFLRNDTASLLLSLAVTAIGALLFYFRDRPPEPQTPHPQSPAPPAPLRRCGAGVRTGSSDPISITEYPIPNIESRIPNPKSEITLSSWLRANWKLVILIEIIFALTFAGGALYRAYVPRIMTAGGEKFMELAFLNGFNRSFTLPPLDPWLSGFGISYYYFGYLIASNLIRLSGVAPSVGFNIAGALLFALTATGVFSLVYNLVAGAAPRLRRASGQDDAPLETASVPPSGGSPLLHPLHRTWVWMAVLGVVFVVFLSNFEAPLEVAHWKGLGSESFWTWLDIADLDRAPPTHQGDQSTGRLTRPGWWWWRASRVIFDYDLQNWPDRYDKTADPPPHRRENIDEFPFFSFLLGDMHPHVLALPFIMLALTASLSLFHTGFTTGHVFPTTGFRIPGIPRRHLILFALIFGALGFFNTWDFPVQWAVAVGAYVVGRFSANQPTNDHTESAAGLPISEPSEPGAGQYIHLRSHLRPILTLAAALAFGGLLLFLPFYIGFQSQAGGPLVHVHSSTRLAHFAIMFGPLLFILIAFLVWGVWRARGRQALPLRTGLWIGGLLLLLCLIVLLITTFAIFVSPSVRRLVAPALMNEDPVGVALRYLGMRLSTPWVTLLLVGMISTAIALLRSTVFGRVVRFSLLLLVAGAGITLVPDYIYLKDVFGVRLNTIFKFYYQGWVLWAIAAAGAVYVMLFAADGLRSTGRWLFAGSLALVLGLGLLYPLLTIPDRVKEFPEAPTLDGTAYLAQEQPADYAAVQWLNTHIKGAPVILETPGGAYQYEGRISAQTGLPTLLGWAGHEHQWRGNTLEQDKRIPVIQELCSTADAQRTLTLLREYDITYVYVGPLERTKCPATGLQKFDRLMDTVYDRDQVTIYKRRDAQEGYAGE